MRPGVIRCTTTFGWPPLSGVVASVSHPGPMEFYANAERVESGVCWRAVAWVTGRGWCPDPLGTGNCQGHREGLEDVRRVPGFNSPTGCTKNRT
jgi:hypothetical protein